MIYQTVRNVSQNVKFCADFVLTATDRAGETYSCDNISKFNPPSPNTFSYDAATRTWNVIGGFTRLKDHGFIVPGNYRLVVLDEYGGIYKSDAIIVRKAGAARCSSGAAQAAQQNPAPTPTPNPAPAPMAEKKCEWIAFTIGSPAKAC